MVTANPIEDRFGYSADLVQSLSSEELNVFRDNQPAGVKAQWAAASVAWSIGFCRLFGVVVKEELDGVLPRSVAIAASVWLTSRIQLWTEDTLALKAKCDGSDPWYEQDLILSRIEHRMRAWAAQLAISEAFQNDEHEFPAEFRSMLEFLERFDRAFLQEKEFIFSAAANTYLLENYRSMLVAPYNNPLPFWLE